MPRDHFYEKILRPLLFAVDPEQAHYFGQGLMSFAGPILSSLSSLPLAGLAYKGDDLKVELFGRQFANPVGIAAGFDKNALLINSYKGMGFGFAEIGSVCARPHGGNPRPRLFRLQDDRALINRLGLNGLGAEVVSQNLSKWTEFPLPLAVNIAKTNNPAISGAAAVEDVAYSFQRMIEFPFAYAVINTSCPNTAEGCLNESRDLERLLDKICSLNTKAMPLLLKLSPDSHDDFIHELIRLSLRYQVSGFVCGNTTLRRDNLKTAEARIAEIGTGGLSGAPLKSLNLALTRKVNALKTERQIIISAGGIMSGADAFDYLSSGASLLQIYTGFVYLGPSASRQICQELSAILKDKGLQLSDLSKSNRQHPLSKS